MAKTLETLRAQTRTYLDEATTADWTDDEVDREINVGYMKAYTTVAGVFEDYYSVKKVATSVANQQEYALPSDCYKIRRVEINYNPSISGSLPKRAAHLSLDEVFNNLGNTSLTVATYNASGYYVRGNNIGLIPIPSDGGASAITLWYIKTVDELVDAEDQIDIPFPDRYYDCIALEAAGTLLRKGQQEEVISKQYLAEAKDRREVMMIELKDRISDGPRQIVDTSYPMVDF